MKYALITILIVIVIAVVGVGAYYFGLKSSGNKTVEQPIPTAAAKPTLQPTQASTQNNTKKVLAGGVLVFPAYTVDIPLVWNALQTGQTDINNLTITNSEYKIVISQAAGGGGGCTYPSDTPSEMSQTFSSFVEINDPNGFIFRRGPTQGSANTWTVCQKETDGSFGFPTVFGNITITTPKTTTNQDMEQIDSILASLKKQ